MAGFEEFEVELESRLEARKTEIQEHDLDTLKQQFRQMQSSFEALHNLLKKKGLIKEDPYNYEERISELDVPSDAPYLESERDTQLSIRLSKYERRLAFLTDYFDCSLENLSLRQIKHVVKFLRYINWPNVSENASQPTTRGMGEQVTKVKRGSDALSANIVTDALDQLSRASRQALSILKRIAHLQREQYKLDMRRSVLTDSKVPEAPPETQREQAVQTVKSVFPQHMPGQPFARDLVLEIFAENSPDGGDAIRRTLLDDLATSNAPKQAKKPQDDLKQMLLESARTLAAASRPLEEAGRKLSDNVLVLESRKLTFGEMVRQVWERMRGKDSDERIFTIDYVDKSTGAHKSEDVSFDGFLEGLRRRSRVYSGLMARSGSAWTKLQNTDEDALLQFVTKDAQELLEVVRRLEGLETFFKTEVSRDQRSQLRSAQTEIVAITDHLNRGRKKARQYVAKQEEREQLRKLGITDS
ncbi:MAG TPA: hypothetical protein VJ932_00655 [Alkalispirochaeta sp.]|nr:hypothetical protein [Alkalispirochaeta sp.]